MTAQKSKTFRSGAATAALFQRRLVTKGTTAEDLALKVGCPLSVVQAILSGRSGEVELPDLQALIIELGGDVAELMVSDPKAV